MKSLIKPLASDVKTKWVVRVKKKDEKIVHVAIDHPSFGKLSYGLTPGGYDGWSFHEFGGGGIVSVPYAKINGILYIGLVEQHRHNQGGKVWNLPRGFLNPGENHFESLSAELAEEIGYTSPDKRLKKLGSPMNPNSAFFETAEKGEGVKFVSVEFSEDQLILNEDGTLSFAEGLMKPVSKSAELIYQCRFFPWRQAIEVGDMFTVAGIGRLLAREMVC